MQAIPEPLLLAHMPRNAEDRLLKGHLSNGAQPFGILDFHRMTMFVASASFRHLKGRRFFAAQGADFSPGRLQKDIASG